MDDLIPRGFRLGAAAADFRGKGADRDDLALVWSELPACAAGVFTANLFTAAPVQVAKERMHQATELKKWAMLFNSGQANACTGEQGLADCLLSCRLLGEHSAILEQDIFPASTGVIGAHMEMDKWRQAIPHLVASLGQTSLARFAKAILTTDAFPKISTREVALTAGRVRLAGVAKGAGMICPNMATMLGVIMCDALLERQVWTELFVSRAKASFNRVTVDGDTSTNDTLIGLANGGSGIYVPPEDLQALGQALTEVLDELAYLLVKDGEGSTKVIKINVLGTSDDQDAEKIARTIGHSQLVKTAMYGKDPNWGRIVAAAGRAGVVFNPNRLVVTLSGVELFRNGAPTDLDFDALLEEPLKATDLDLNVQVGDGPGSYLLLASDLSHDYVSINSHYRS